MSDGLRGLLSPWFDHPATRRRVTRDHSERVAGCLGDGTITTGRVWGGSGRDWEMGQVKFTSQPKSGDRFQTWIQDAPSSPSRQQWRRDVVFRGTILLCHHVTQSPVIYSHTCSICRGTSGTNSHTSASTSCLKAYQNSFFPLLSIPPWLHHAASLMPVKAPIHTHFMPPWVER